MALSHMEIHTEALSVALSSDEHHHALSRLPLKKAWGVKCHQVKIKKHIKLVLRAWSLPRFIHRKHPHFIRTVNIFLFHYYTDMGGRSLPPPHSVDMFLASVFNDLSPRVAKCVYLIGNAGEVRHNGVLLCGVRRFLGGLCHRHQEYGHGMLLHGSPCRDHHLPLHHLSRSVRL